MNPFSDFGVTFVNPWLLLLLLLIPLLSYLRGQRGGSPTVVFSSTEPLHTLGKRVQNRAGNFLTSLLFLALALLIVALARPQKGTTLTHVEASGVDIMLVLDVSGSMEAEDFTIGNRAASRISVVKKVTEKFIEQRPNDRLGIIAFAGRPYLVSPLTLDHDWLLQNMDRVRTHLVEDSTAIGSALASAANRLRGDKNAKSRIIILLTDGDNNKGDIEPVPAAELAAALRAKLYTIGIGREEPCMLPNFDPATGKLRLDAAGQVVPTIALQPANYQVLDQMSRLAHGRFFRATNRRELENIYHEIDRLEKTEIKLRRFTTYTPLFQWPLVAAFALLTLELVLASTRFRRIP